jgi:hypothetical protein
MSFIDNDSVGDPAVGRFSTFAAAAIVGTATVTIPAGRKRDVCNAGKPTENISKALKEDWITGIVSGNGESVSDAA